MSEDEPSVPVVCETCGTTTDVPVSEVATTVETHNDRLHDGAQRAVVDPAVVERIQRLAAADLFTEE